MSLLSIFGFGKTKIKELVKSGAVIIDVRLPSEFDRGKVPGSINIPLDRIESQIKKIKDFNKPIIFCCASGMRSGMATRILKNNQKLDVTNGGSWSSLLKIKNSI